MVGRCDGGVEFGLAVVVEDAQTTARQAIAGNTMAISTGQREPLCRTQS